MRIYIYDEGKPKDGKLSNKMIVDLQWDIGSLDIKERNTIRKTFMEFAKDKLDFCYGKTAVSFEDECIICKEKLFMPPNGGVRVCINKMCPDYQLTQEEQNDERISFRGEVHTAPIRNGSNKPNVHKSILEIFREGRGKKKQ